MIIAHSSGATTVHVDGQFTGAIFNHYGDHPLQAMYFRVYQRAGIHTIAHAAVRDPDGAQAADVVDVIADAIREDRPAEALVVARGLEWRPSSLIVNRLRWLGGNVDLLAGATIAHAMWNDPIMVGGRPLDLLRADGIEFLLGNDGPVAIEARVHLVCRQYTPEEITLWRKRHD